MKENQLDTIKLKINFLYLISKSKMTEIRHNFLTVKIMLKNIANLHNGTKKNPNPFLDFSKKFMKFLKSNHQNPLAQNLVPNI